MNQKFNSPLEEDVLSQKAHIYFEMLELHFHQDLFIVASKLLWLLCFFGSRKWNKKKGKILNC